jgi:hypothetical protein
MQNAIAALDLCALSDAIAKGEISSVKRRRSRWSVSI